MGTHDSARRIKLIFRNLQENQQEEIFNRHKEPERVDLKNIYCSNSES